MQVKTEASWDSTVHECPQLSRVTPAEQRVYLTVKTVVQLSHPADMQLVLRKRICVSVTGRQVGKWKAMFSFFLYNPIVTTCKNLLFFERMFFFCGRVLLRAC